MYRHFYIRNVTLFLCLGYWLTLPWINCHEYQGIVVYSHLKYKRSGSILQGPFIIQDVTQGVTQGVTQDVTQGETQGGTQGILQDEELDDWIEKQIKKNPKITAKELALLSQKGLNTIRRRIAKLPHIQYVGSGYSGHWKIKK